MYSFNVNICELTISASHLQASVAEQSLQAEYITTIFEEGYGGSMTEGMGRTPYSNQFSFLPVLSHHLVRMSPGYWSTVLSKEDRVTGGSSRFGTATVNVVPEYTLKMLPYWDHTLLIPFTDHLSYTIFQPQSFHLQTAKLRYSDTRIK
jgi:hypothetical protein